MSEINKYLPKNCEECNIENCKIQRNIERELNSELLSRDMWKMRKLEESCKRPDECPLEDLKHE